MLTSLTQLSLSGINLDPVVSLDDVKDHLGIVDDYSDDRLTLYIEAATSFIEHETGRQFRSVQWREVYDSFPRGAYQQGIRTFRFPVTTIASLTYYDSANNLQTLIEGTDYYSALDQQGPAVLVPAGTQGNWVFPSWPTENYLRPDAVTLVYYAASTIIPSILPMAIKLLVTHWNDGNRGSNELDIPPGIERLYGHLRAGSYR